MKINSKTKKAIAEAAVKMVTAKNKVVTKVAKLGATITGNFWKKLKEIGSYSHGVKLYCLRAKDYTGQALVDWDKAKGKDTRVVLHVNGARGCAMMEVHAKGNIVRVSNDKGFDIAQFKSARLITRQDAIKTVKTKGKAIKGFVYNGKTFNGWQLSTGEFYSVFTDGVNLFECEESRISGKSLEQAKHVYALGGK